MIFAVLVVATRYVSVGSIAAALACPFFAFYLYWPNLPAACAISIAALLVVFAHRENIKRLINHNENHVSARRRRRES